MLNTEPFKITSILDKFSIHNPVSNETLVLKQPSLIIIPDIDRNQFISKEAINVNIPIIGLLSTNNIIKIDYPIFGNNHSIHVVHFFCHFVAKLIKKEIKGILTKNILSSFFVVPKNKKHNLERQFVVKRRLRNKNKQQNSIKSKKDRKIKVKRKRCIKF